MKITEYHPIDKTQIYSILKTEPNAVWSFSQLEHTLEFESVVTFVARNGEQVLGFVILEQTSFDFDILEIVVDERFRGQGIGKILMDKVMEFARLNHKEKATLEVAEGNKPAIALYEKFGFNKISIRKKYYPNGSDALVYQKIF